MDRMNRRLTALILAMVMVAGTLTGCGSAKEVTDTEKAEETESADAVITADEPVDTADVADTENNNEGTGSENFVTTGGTPWICSVIKSNVTADMELSPKDDFYLYVNHDWIMNNEIPEGLPYYSPDIDMHRIVRDNCIAILEDNTLKGREIELVRALYNAFLDWDERNKTGLTPVADIVKRVDDIGSIDELSDFICDIDLIPVTPAILKAGYVADIEDSSRYVLGIIQYPLTLNDAAEYKDRTDMGDRYYNATKSLTGRMLERMGYTRDKAEAVYEDFYDLESKIAEVSYTLEQENATDYYDRIRNYYTMEELGELSPHYPLTRYIETIGLVNADTCLVFNPDVVKKIDELYTEDNLDRFKNYTIIKLLLAFSACLDRTAYDDTYEVMESILGDQGGIEDEVRAYGFVQTYLPDALGKAYVEKYDLTKLKEDIESLCHDMIAEYKLMLDEEDWLEEETREMAKEKLDCMTINSMYSDDWEDYGSLNLDGLSNWECFRAISEYQLEKEANRTDMSVNEKYLKASMLDTNCYYSSGENAMYICAGYLGDPIHFEAMSEEERLGHIGIAIAHEISHAFDTTCSQFDKDGNYSDWWTEKDYEEFNKRAGKVIEYYDNTTLWTGKNIDGTNVRNEAIADMGGMKLVLRLASKKSDFDYDVFFRAYADFLKMIISPEYLEYINRTDPHPSYHLRTNVTLQQFDEFLDTYDIKEGDNMYLAPEDRILVW